MYKIALHLALWNLGGVCNTLFLVIIFFCTFVLLMLLYCYCLEGI